jgi:uncharacterized protein YqeY
MTLLEQISEDMKTAMRAKDERTLSTVRMLKSALKNKQIDLMRELTEEDALAVVKSQMKQLKEAQEIAANAGRPEAAQEAQAEMDVLTKYLPAQMSDDALEIAVRAALDGAGLRSKQDMGKAMGVAMKAAAGQADGSRVKAVVEKILAGFVLGLALLPQAVDAATGTPSPFLSETVLRTIRIFFMLMGIVCVNFVLIGAFELMTAGGRDHGHHSGLHKLIMGLLGTVFMAGLITIVSVMIGKIS